jgi:hypothetical protein
VLACLGCGDAPSSDGDSATSGDTEAGTSDAAQTSAAPESEGSSDGDACPSDPDKTEPGACGCGTPDEDADEDGTADCDDACPSDPDKIDAGAGPDEEHQGKEICITFDGSLGAIGVVDMTDKAMLVELSRTVYSGASYAHQGWLTEDHAYLLHNDEFDEVNAGHYTRTYIWDFRDLDAPEVIGTYEGMTNATDHNLYTHEGRLYEANYRSGVRVFDLADVADGMLTELAWFDTDPTGDGPELMGAFTALPYFERDIVVVTDMQRGVFVLDVTR